MYTASMHGHHYVVTFTLTREMATDIARELMLDDPASMADVFVRRARLWTQFALGVALGIFGLVVLIRSRSAPVEVIHLGVVAGILGLFSGGLLWDWNQKRRSLNAHLRDPIADNPEVFGELGPVRFTLSEADISWNSCGQTMTWTWPRIFRFDDLPSYIAIRGRMGTPMAIPKSAFAADGARAFLMGARAIHAAKGLDQQARLREYLSKCDYSCPKCAYQLRNAAGDRCPECGLALTYELLPDAAAIAPQDDA